MNNIIGYICNTAWGTVSRTADSLGWVPANYRKEMLGA